MHGEGLYTRDGEDSGDYAEGKSLSGKEREHLCEKIIYNQRMGELDAEVSGRVNRNDP